MKKEYYAYTNIPLNEVVWAYAYSTETVGKTLTLRKEPIEGIIVKNDTTRARSWQDDYFFYELGKDRKPKKTTKVRARNRSYALTKEDAIIGYNNKIDCHIKRLEGEIDFHKNNKLK